MRTLRWVLTTALGVILVLAVIAASRAQTQQILQQGFEAPGPYWKPGSSDADYKVVSHALTEETAHQGQRSEHLRLQVEKGTYIHYTFDVPRAPITDELNFVLWLKSNRPGVQLFCRVVLPRERDPKNLERNLTVLVKCDPYASARWKLLTLRQPVKRLREQQQLLAHQQNRPIDTTGAYIDQVVLNVFDGPGLTDVYIDDLEIGPVLAGTEAVAAPKVVAVPGLPAAARKSAEVQVKGGQLWVDGKRFLMVGIRHTGTPMSVLHDAGFNTVWMDGSTTNQALADASALGMRIVPSLVPPGALTNGGTLEGQLTSGGGFARNVSRFLDLDGVLAWDIGSNLGAERFMPAAKLVREFRKVDPGRVVLGDIWDGFKGYSRQDGFLVGTHRWPLMTSLELPAYRDWLMTRRRLSADAYTWTWIQTHTPDWFLNLSRPAKEGADYKEPIGPHPEQIRLMTYFAFGAGFRGVAYWSDRFLADSHQGRDRLLAMALLNQELRLVEPLLVSSTTPEWIDTNNKDVKAVVFRGPDGILVVPMWMGAGSQFVPGQAATPELVVTVPGVPHTATAWEVSPGRMQAYQMTREIEGSQVKLKNFSLSSALVFTSDLGPQGLVVRLQDRQHGMARLAVQYLHDQAKEELSKVEKVNAELNEMGHSLRGAAELLAGARKALDECNAFRKNGEHAEGYTRAELALRSLRVLMRGHWERTVRNLDNAVASPFAVSFFTLPRHYRMLARVAASRPAASALADGDFELDPERAQSGWIVQQVPSLDEVDVRVRRTPEAAHGGKQSLMMRVTPKSPARVPVALERTYVALHSPAVKLPPGTLVRVSAWVRTPQGVVGSPDGAMFFDSAGGEPLAMRITQEQGKWQRYAMYREVPASGLINVSLAMSGMGTVYFDDVRIEPLDPATTNRAKP